MLFAPIKNELSRWLSEGIREVLGVSTGTEFDFAYEVPREEKFGDLSTAIVLKLAREAKKNPRALADDLLKRLTQSLPKSSLAGRLARVSVEGPGFINFYFSTQEISQVISHIYEQREHFGKPALASKKILLEFVSANPTGPLTVAHGRQAALGDSLARILRFCGHRVTTEYYNNDEGVQIDTLGKSTALRVEEITSGKKIDIPENFYRGEYLVEIAKKFTEKFKASASTIPTSLECGDFAKNDILEGIQKDLAEFDVHFDHFYSQKELGSSGKVEKMLEELKTKKATYESEGALWLRSTEWGDDKDRVLVKSDKTYTYLMPDIAYHHEKFGRGFEEIIDILGPDHHGYIARLKASQAALGHDPERVRVLIAQLVTLYEGKKQVRMSTRAGEFITLRQILDEVGKDAGRFFFVMRKFDAHLDFDLELAKSQTPDNPVFYIQYAHARIESIKSNAGLKSAETPRPEARYLDRLVDEREIRLMRLLWQYEETLLGAEKTLEPYRLVPYLMDLAATFHRFYTENRVVTDDETLTQARLMLVNAVQSVLKSGLGLLGVSAPTKM
jgi:arginyl-tRNA synthetase